MPATFSHYDKDGGTVITEYGWADIIAGATDTPRKFASRNIGDRTWLAGTLSIVADVDEDGDDQLRIALDSNSTLTPPFNVAAAVVAGTGTFGATGTYGYVLSCVNGTGETIASLEVTAAITVTTQHVNLTWEVPSGTTAIKVFRTATAGTYGASTLRATLGAGATNYTDTGGAVGAGTPALTNTTGGVGPNYGTAPLSGSFSTSPLAVPEMKIGRMFFYWVKRVVPLGTPEAGNDRTADLEFAETLS